MAACGDQDAPSPPAVADSPDAASWKLGAGASVRADATEVDVLVHEQNCSGGETAEGRIAPPIIIESLSSIEITIGVHQLVGDQSCQDTPWTPFVVELPLPVGERDLLDGSVEPPAVRHRSD